MLNFEPRSLLFNFERNMFNFERKITIVNLERNPSGLNLSANGLAAAIWVGASRCYGRNSAGQNTPPHMTKVSNLLNFY
jgi:hypothetical protein